MMNPRPPTLRCAPAFTLMEVVVVVAILLILASITMPVVKTFRTRGNQAVALNNLRQLGAAATKYMGDHENAFPREDAAGKDTWAGAADPANAEVWYNALPRLAGAKGTGDYVADPRSFYTKSNLLFLPGAGYPDDDRKLGEPVFAIAMNSRLQRKDAAGEKADVRLTSVLRPSRTVLLFERGIKGEKQDIKAAPGYDGRPKGNGRAFVARYGGRGHVLFVDGHADLVRPEEVMDEAARLRVPQTDIIWTADPNTDPN